MRRLPKAAHAIEVLLGEVFEAKYETDSGGVVGGEKRRVECRAQEGCCIGQRLAIDSAAWLM